MSLKVLRNKSKGFEIRNTSATKAEIIIYSSIGESWWGDSVSAKSFNAEIDKLDSAVNELNIRINSPGGDVFDGITIYNLFKAWKKRSTSNKVIVHVDGLAASIASVIALAGDEVIMGEGSLFMIHLPWTFAMGNRTELDKTIDRLVKAEEQLITIYVNKTKMDREEVRDMLEAGTGEGTWMDADQAIEKGFADKKSDEETVPLAASVLGNATWIKNKPRIPTRSDVARKEIENLHSKVSAFIGKAK